MAAETPSANVASRGHGGGAVKTGQNPLELKVDTKTAGEWRTWPDVCDPKWLEQSMMKWLLTMHEHHTAMFITWAHRN